MTRWGACSADKIQVIHTAIESKTILDETTMALENYAFLDCKSWPRPSQETECKATFANQVILNSSLSSIQRPRNCVTAPCTAREHTIRVGQRSAGGRGYPPPRADAGRPISRACVAESVTGMPATRPKGRRRAGGRVPKGRARGCSGGLERAC